jgi:hypothetical protein
VGRISRPYGSRCRDHAGDRRIGRLLKEDAVLTSPGGTKLGFGFPSQRHLVPRDRRAAGRMKANSGAGGICCPLSIHLADAVVDPAVDDAGPLFEAFSGGRKNILGVMFSEGPITELAIKSAMRRFHLSNKTRSEFVSILKQYVADAFVAMRKVGAHIVVGNPPWMTWDGLTDRYSEKVAPQWASSSLFTNKGWRAKVAAGKTDFSSLFVYRAAQRHASFNAVMVFVLPLYLFQSRLAGEGFRTFRTAEGRSFPPVEIDDFSDVKVFSDAVNRTSVGTFLVDREPKYPISYKTWRADYAAGRLQ